MADSLRELVKLKQKELELYAEVTKKMFPTGDTAEYPVSWESLLYSFQCYVEEDITRTDIGDIRERLERAGITKEKCGKRSALAGRFRK